MFYDNHNHSQFSFDGKRTSIEATSRYAMTKGLDGLCFTDHCDFHVPPMKAEHEDLVPEEFDIAAQQAEIDRVSGLLPGLNILKGIEVGMYATCHEQISKMLSEHTFDQVIASVHYLDNTDPFYGGYYEGKTWQEAYGHYLETIYTELTWLGNFDIMGHFDYVVRYAPYEVCAIRYKDFSDLLDELFKYLIANGKALEINTKTYQNYGAREIVSDPNLLLRYKELGGEIISLGSDSHDKERVGYRFGDTSDYLKSLGFKWIAHFENRILKQAIL